MTHQEHNIYSLNQLDLDSLDVDILIAFKRKLDATIKQKNSQAKLQLKKKLQVKASRLGINLTNYFEDTFPSKKNTETTSTQKIYEYKGVQWSGRGRHPKVFEQYFQNGGEKSDLLINKQH
jgi:DNA-binding protein H-NS